MRTLVSRATAQNDQLLEHCDAPLLGSHRTDPRKIVRRSSMRTASLPFKILDADNHFNEPRNCFDGYIDSSKKDLAIRWVKDEHGRDIQLFAGKPSRFSVAQITFSANELESMLGELPSVEQGPENMFVPGSLLNRLNPLKGLS